MRDNADRINSLAAAFVERDRKFRLAVFVSSGAVVALTVALVVGSILTRYSVARERAAGSAFKARLDSLNGVLVKAEWSYQSALALDEKALGPKHADVAKDLKSLAMLYIATGRNLEAEQMMRRALRIDEQSYGREHPKVAGDLVGLAGLLDNLGRSAEADSLEKRAKGWLACSLYTPVP